jgi:hypothetical protein
MSSNLLNSLRVQFCFSFFYICPIAGSVTLYFNPILEWHIPDKFDKEKCYGEENCVYTGLIFDTGQ